METAKSGKTKKCAVLLTQTPLAWMLGEFLATLDIPVTDTPETADILAVDPVSLKSLPPTLDPSRIDLVLIPEDPEEFSPPESSRYRSVTVLPPPFFSQAVKAAFSPLLAPGLKELFPEWEASEAAENYFSGPGEYLEYLAGFAERYQNHCKTPPPSGPEALPLLHDLKSHAGLIGNPELRRRATELHGTLKGGESIPRSQWEDFWNRLAEDCRQIRELLN